MSGRDFQSLSGMAAVESNDPLAFVLTWAMSRHRLPVDAVLLIYAAVAIATLIERRRRRNV